MTKEEKLNMAIKKLEAKEHQKILQENRDKKTQDKIELSRKILIGEMFIKHFPIALKITPGKTSAENAQIFDPLDNFMESLSQCQQSYQEIEDTLIQLHRD